MKTLETYSKNGYQFTLVKRIGKHATYRGCKKDSKASTYETIEIQHHNGMVIRNRDWVPAEYPPHNGLWGVKGWTYATQDKALDKLETLASL